MNFTPEDGRRLEATRFGPKYSTEACLAGQDHSGNGRWLRRYGGDAPVGEGKADGVALEQALVTRRLQPHGENRLRPCPSHHSALIRSLRLRRQRLLGRRPRNHRCILDLNESCQ